jgi:hypothetical protein
MAIAGNELSYNSESMETSAASWSVLANCTIAQSAAQAREGGFSLAITSLASGVANGICNTANQAFPLATPTLTYQLFYAVYTTTAGLSITPTWDWYNGSTFLSANTGSAIPLAANTWTWISLQGTAPASTTLARVYPGFTATAASQVVFFDEIYFGPPTSFPFSGMPVPQVGSPQYNRRMRRKQQLILPGTPPVIVPSQDNSPYIIGQYGSFF